MTGAAIRALNPNAVAREIVTDPALSGTLPLATIQEAWVALKQGRGQAVNLDRIGKAAHIIGAYGCLPIAALTARVHARARAIGQTGPAPLILNDVAGGNDQPPGAA